MCESSLNTVLNENEDQVDAPVGVANQEKYSLSRWTDECNGSRQETGSTVTLYILMWNLCCLTVCSLSSGSLSKCQNLKSQFEHLIWFQWGPAGLFVTQLVQMSPSLQVYLSICGSKKWPVHDEAVLDDVTHRNDRLAFCLTVMYYCFFLSYFLPVRTITLPMILHLQHYTFHFATGTTEIIHISRFYWIKAEEESQLYDP